MTKTRKQRAIEEVQTSLANELSELSQFAEAQDAVAQARAAEIQRQLLILRFLPKRQLSLQDSIVPGAFFRLELDGKLQLDFLLVPQGGGLVTQFEGIPLQVITPLSPIGEAVLGKHVGDTVEVESRGTTRRYRVLTVS